MIIATIPNSMAQPEPSLGNWELGIEYPDEDESNPFIVSEAGMASITMFVDNQGLLSVKSLLSMISHLKRKLWVHLKTQP